MISKTETCRDTESKSLGCVLKGVLFCLIIIIMRPLWLFLQMTDLGWFVSKCIRLIDSLGNPMLC